MKIQIENDPVSLGQAAGRHAGELIRRALHERGQANIILATGTSQFETLNQLVREDGIDWAQVVMFHLDEYIGLPDTHPASFRNYLRERFLAKLPSLKAAHLINGETNPQAECIWLGDVITQFPIDVALVGIGENGHLAFNDPPADFEIDEPYIIVELDDACRQQQFKEGWFKTVEAVPKQAISMSVRQILKSKAIICSVPDDRKAQAVKNCVESSVSTMFPATILQTHNECTLYLDKASASGLSRK